MTFRMGFRWMVCILLGYLIGNINPAYIICRRHGYDVRTSGSKNAGASNALIISGKRAGFVTAAVDIAKAAAAWRISAALYPELRLAGILGGVSCTLGHMFPVLLGFRGGKGLACMGGVILAYSPKAFLAMLIFAAVVAVVSGYICVVTVSVGFAWPLFYLLMTGYLLGAALLMLPAVPIFFKHLENFKRIKAGEELRLRYIWDKSGELKRTGHAR